jgi:four helix bundle protein
MTYERFEDLPVWKAAISLALAIFDLLDDRAFGGIGDLRNQLQRAALSISNNIAEGFERGTTAELLMFIYIARGSAGEARSALRFALERPMLHHLKSQISNLISQSEAVSRQLRGWAGSLQNSDIPGQRRMTEQSQTEYRQRKRAESFLEKLDAYRNSRSGDSQDQPPK